MKEFVYQLLQLITDFVMHIPIAGIRNLFGYLIFKHMGKGSQISRHVHLISPHKIVIGENVFINRNVIIDGRMGVSIGDNSDIGEFVSIWSLQHDYNDFNHSTLGGETIIEDHCWIAPHSIILPNRVLKRGTVVGTGSVVTKDFPEKSVIAGVPAKIIKVRENDLNYQLTYKIYL